MKVLNSLKYSSLLAVAISGSAFGHANIAPENALIIGDGPREYKEGSSPYLSMTVGHDCSDANGMHFPTTGVVAILPNSEALPPNDFYTSSRDGEMHHANAFMSTKPRKTSVWNRQVINIGPVVPYYNHGIKEEDARALKWLVGFVNNDMYDSLEFRTNLPKFKAESCYSKLRVEIPVVQYCQSNHYIAWIGTAGSSFQESKIHRVETEYEPYFNVVRDMAKNPLPAHCGDGEEMSIRPSDMDVDLFGKQWGNPTPAQLQMHAPMMPEEAPAAAEQPAPEAEQPAAEAEQPMAEAPMPDAAGNCPDGYEFFHDMSDHTNKCRLIGS